MVQLFLAGYGVSTNRWDGFGCVSASIGMRGWSSDASAARWLWEIRHGGRKNWFKLSELSIGG